MRRPDLLTITQTGHRGTVEPRRPSGRTRVATTCVAVAGLLLPSGCATTGPPAGITDESSSSIRIPPPVSSHVSPSEPSISSQSAPDAELHGTVHGIVVREGGRDPRSGGGGTTGSVPVGADPITAHRAETKEPVARTVTANDGSFEFNLPPGTYRITEEITGASKTVDVTSKFTSTVTITLPGA